ncbi:hypothetical protein [Roseixanthobacter glucoisosaccharinicivorans]|uniref:hypothetical protein n=1 Tax=Roseixanthobacter glucoisosaccharinicivorans TaxID=3119923 RepID=UPI0037283CC9
MTRRPVCSANAAERAPATEALKKASIFKEACASRQSDVPAEFSGPELRLGQMPTHRGLLRFTIYPHKKSDTARIKLFKLRKSAP